MPTRNISLTPELDREVAARVASGQYENASEVMRAALRALAHQERSERARERWLEHAIAEGDESGIAKGDVFERIRKELGLPSQGLVKGRVYASHVAERTAAYRAQTKKSKKARG